MRIDVKVVAKASCDRVKEESGRFKVYVTAPPEDGKANAACLKLLSKHFGVAPKDVTLVRGHRSPRKVFTIEQRSFDADPAHGRGSLLRMSPEGR